MNNGGAILSPQQPCAPVVVPPGEEEAIRSGLRLGRVELGDLLAWRGPRGPAICRGAVPQVVSVNMVDRAVERVVPVVHPGCEQLARPGGDDAREQRVAGSIRAVGRGL